MRRLFRREAQSLGIRPRLLLAFGVLSAFTLLASVIGWVAQERLGNELNTVVEENIRALGLMAGLKEQGVAITSMAPTLMAVQDDASRGQIWLELEHSMSAMGKLLPELSTLTRKSHTEAVLAEQIASLRRTLQQLDGNVSARLAIDNEKQSENQRLRWVAAGFLSEISTLIEDVQLRLNSRFNQDLPDSGIVSNNFGETSISVINTDLQLLYRMKADVNLLINLVDRAQHLPDLNSLIATEIHAEEIIDRINNDLHLVSRLSGTPELKQTVGNIVALTKGDNNMFTIRREERAVVETGVALLNQVKADLASLNRLIGAQAGATERAAQQVARNAKRSIGNNQMWMLLMVAASLLLSVVIVWLYVGRNMVARITLLDASMQRIAAGNLDERVPVTGSDEIGAMANSLRSFRDQLTDMQTELGRAGKLAALGQLSAGIAHEINQPLAAISHYAHNGLRLLAAGRLAEAEQNLTRISELTRRATTIITRLKSLARSPQENRVVVELRGVVNNVLSMFEGHALRQLVTVELSFPAARNEVLADPVQLEQVVLNLFSNALDALEERPEKRINISCQHAGDYLELCLQDTGPGIDPALQDKILEPFFTTKRIGQGLGLGLSISYNIIKDFGGKLLVANAADGGASFSIHLPVYQGES